MRCVIIILSLVVLVKAALEPYDCSQHGSYKPYKGPCTDTSEHHHSSE